MECGKKNPNDGRFRPEDTKEEETQDDVDRTKENIGHRNDVGYAAV